MEIKTWHQGEAIPAAWPAWVAEADIAWCRWEIDAAGRFLEQYYDMENCLVLGRVSVQLEDIWK